MQVGVCQRWKAKHSPTLRWTHPVDGQSRLNQPAPPQTVGNPETLPAGNPHAGSSPNLHEHPPVGTMYLCKNHSKNDALGVRGCMSRSVAEYLMLVMADHTDNCGRMQHAGFLAAMWVCEHYVGTSILGFHIRYELASSLYSLSLFLSLSLSLYSLSPFTPFSSLSLNFTCI